MNDDRPRLMFHCPSHTTSASRAGVLQCGERYQLQIPVLYRDDDLIVVDKPAGIPTHSPDPADPYLADALRILRRQEGLDDVGMHQRLDAETSGVLVFAARPEANRALAAAFEGRRVRKVYVALVHGAPRKAEGTVDAAIVRDKGERYRAASANDRRGQPAVTKYRVLQTFTMAGAPEGGGVPPRRCSLVEVVPETGRSHQIRVHLASIGAPVVGDRLYGPADQPAPRLCLHAHEITLPHPATGRPVTFTAPLPPLLADGPHAAPALVLAAGRAHIREAIRFPEGLRGLLHLAADRRAPLADDPETTIYRLVNGEADGLRGLTADRYGSALVASIYDDGGTIPPAPCPPALVDMLASETGALSVYMKYRPRQASRIPEAQVPLVSPPQPVFGPHLGEVIVCENGLLYRTRPGDGLSTGLYPDMRAGRARVRAWADGRRVLNCFAYTCGFGVAAAAGGARRVLNLDLSRAALAWGQDNYRLNGFEPDPHDFVYGDVFDWLARLARRRELFDLVILDPPGFSRTKQRSFNAARDYAGLAGMAARVAARDALLLACCNVAELAWRAFRDRVLAGLAEAGRTAEIVGVYHEPAIDHPSPWSSEPYLKMLAVRLN
jgi:23S rRNA (cytosine1962-C5)-methyltransferase